MILPVLPSESFEYHNMQNLLYSEYMVDARKYHTILLLSEALYDY